MTENLDKNGGKREGQPKVALFDEKNQVTPLLSVYQTYRRWIRENDSFIRQNSPKSEDGGVKIVTGKVVREGGMSNRGHQTHYMRNPNRSHESKKYLELKNQRLQRRERTS